MVMQPDELRSTLHGVIAFPVTPFRSDLSLDLDGLRKNLRALIEHPLAAIVAAGGTGELYSLTPADGLLEYYRTIGRATPLALLVYSRDWFHPGSAFVERLAHIPTLVAWKEGQADIRRLQTIRTAVGDRLQWIGGAGDDMVPAYYAVGIRAFTSSVANVAPRLALELHERASRGDDATLPRLMADLVVPLYALRARRRGYEVTVMKALMNLLGLAGGAVRPPLVDLRPDEMEALRALAPRWKSVAEGL